MTAWFALLPVLTLALVTAAGHPGGADPAPWRLAAMRAALVTGAFGVLLTEGLSALHALTPPAVRLAWLLATVVAGAVAVKRGRLPRPRPPSLGWPGWVLVAGLAVLILADLVVALVAAPNNADSMSYHLPRIEHWVQDRSVAFYPTSIHRQAGVSPGAEYLLTQLRLLAGPEEFYNLLQWAAGLGCALVASWVAAQLGARRAGQLLAAATVLTAPMVLLESTSTQTDLVVALWVACGAGLALTGTNPGFLGLATGLTTVTKVNGLAVLAPFLVLWAVRERHRPARLAARTAVVLAVALVLAGPFQLRSQREWGGLGDDPDVASIALERHDPAAVAVNGARIAATVLTTPFSGVNDLMVRAVDGFGNLVHVRPDAPGMIFGAPRFVAAVPPYPDEDHIAYPIQALAVLLGVGYGLLRRRGYAAAVAASLVLTAALVAWQPWVNRLILPAFVVGTPLVGVAADRLRNRSGQVLVAVVVLLAGAQAAYSVWAGQPRPLGIADSVLTVSRERDRYARFPNREQPYQDAARRVVASGARRVGLIQGNTAWEYAWWVELRRAGAHPTVVDLDSVLPGHPAPPVTSVDAVLCTFPQPDCAARAPRGWTVVTFPDSGPADPAQVPAQEVSVLLPPGR